MTIPSGRSFLSYRRTRLSEAIHLIRAQHLVGVPTWQDVSDLPSEPTELEIRNVLGNVEISNGVLLITPEIEDSVVIQKVEIPMLLSRHATGDGFFLVPVVAGGLDYDEASRLVDATRHVTELRNWNLLKVAANPIGIDDALAVAEEVLVRRIKEVHRKLPTNSPMVVALHTRTKPAHDGKDTLVIDWSDEFENRLARRGAWSGKLLPAAKTIVRIVEQHAPGRIVEFHGLASLTAAMAMGSAFLAPRGIEVFWRQRTGDRTELWAIHGDRDASGFASNLVPAVTASDELAVLISVSQRVDEAFAASKPSLPDFRALVHIRHPAPARDAIGAAQAAGLVELLVRELQSARAKLQPKRVHLFFAGPVGLAFLIGQALNTFGPVQTYEHDPVDAVGRYVPSVLLRPGA
jgi:hypothetical protein